MRKLLIALFLLSLLALAAAPWLLSKHERVDEELKIISPHWDGIRHEFGAGFEKHYFEKTGRRIHVEWLDIGATGEIKKYLNERFGQIRPDEGVGADILFGGGMDMLPGMADANFFEAYTPPAEIFKDIPDSLNGQPLRDPKNRFHAACLSTFGIVYNTEVLKRARLPVPQTWEDLARPEFQGWVTCGNPVQSGAVHATLEVILQGQGWEKGCNTITRLCSNVRAFNEGGSSVPRDVSLGQAAAGPCIDFYASAPVRRQGATHLQLVIPAAEAVATPDCISVLRSPVNHAAALAFMEFVLSEKGQRLWYQSRNEPGGPEKYDLERLPVMPRIYEMGLPTHIVINPFKQKATFRYDSKKAGERWATMDDLWRSTLIEVLDDLWNARRAIIENNRESDLGAELGRAAMSEDDLLTIARKRMPADARNALRNRWSAWARERYKQFENAARTKGPVPAYAPAPKE